MSSDLITSKTNSMTSRRLPKQNKDNNLPPSKVCETDLLEWAHEGTKESIQKIQAFIDRTDEEHKSGFARIALDEAWDIYLSPNGKQEEEELLLLKMTSGKQARFFEVSLMLDSAEHELRKLQLDRTVHARMRDDGKLEEDEEYYFSEDDVSVVRGRYEELDKEKHYLQNWIDTAKGMIKTERYQQLPDGYLDSMHYTAEGGDFWEEDGS